MTDELIAFLHARFDDEEASAQFTAEVYGKSWWWNPSWGLVKGDSDNDSETTSIFSVGEETIAEVWSEVGPHIARHDPDRALREIDAKRRTLVRCQKALVSASPMLVHFAKETLKEMALPYASHRDYLKEQQ